jgi:hypothetical protein
MSYHWFDYPTRYVADANPQRKHVHDLANEQKSSTLQAVEWAKNTLPFATKEEAYAAGY